MDQNPPPAYEHQPAVPPTIPGALPEPPRRTKWPTILGVIAIILAIIGLLSGLAGIAGAFAPEMFPQIPEEARQQMEAGRTWTLIGSVVALPLSALLLAGGIGLVNRRRWSASALKSWAIIDIVWTVVNLGATWKMQMDGFQYKTGLSGPGEKQVMQIIMAVGMAIGLVFALGPPIFLLIWLARAKIKAEVASWR